MSSWLLWFIVTKETKKDFLLPRLSADSQSLIASQLIAKQTIYGSKLLQYCIQTADWVHIYNTSDQVRDEGKGSTHRGGGRVLRGLASSMGASSSDALQHGTTCSVPPLTLVSLHNGEILGTGRRGWRAHRGGAAKLGRGDFTLPSWAHCKPGKALRTQQKATRILLIVHTKCTLAH